MTGRRTFASDEDRENFELDRLDADATELADHETRITTLEGSGGGGMAESMYAAGAWDIDVGGGDGENSIGLFTLGNVIGTDPPSVNLGDPSILDINGTGYHMVAVFADADTASAAELINFTFRWNSALGAPYNFPVPLVFTALSPGTGPGGHLAAATLPVHLTAGDQLDINVVYTNLAASRHVHLYFAFSRIGTNHPDGPNTI